MILSGWRRLRADILFLALMIAGILLNIAAPVWLTPPLFQYSIWLYVALALAWVPVYLIVRRRQGAHAVPRFILLGLMLSCFFCATFRPRSMFTTVVWLDILRCESLPADEGRIRYTCTREAFDGPQFNRTLILEGVPGVPLLWLVEEQMP